MSPPSSFLTLLTSLPLALGHSHLAYILINNHLYQGFDPRPDQFNNPAHVGWSTAATDDGFVAPANYSHPDIICHTDGASPPAHAPVRAGDRVHVQWNGWPEGHVGPVLSYIARCGGLRGSASGCTGVDKTELRWTKVDNSAPVMEVTGNATGHQDPPWSGVPGARWATDVLIAANNSWVVEIPSGLSRGPYVLRHEIIALHFAGKKGGAQNYPLCVNLWVDGEGGTGQGLKLDAYEATKFYKEDDPGVLVNVTAGLKSYVVPGPTIAVGATPVPYAEQRAEVSKAEGTPVVVTRSTETVPFNGAATPTSLRKVRGRYDREH